MEALQGEEGKDGGGRGEGVESEEGRKERGEVFVLLLVFDLEL